MIQDNGFETLLFGQYLVRDIAACQRNSLADPDWSEDEVLASPTWVTLLKGYGLTKFDDRSDRTFPQSRTPDQRESRSGSLRQQLDDSWSPPEPPWI